MSDDSNRRDDSALINLVTEMHKDVKDLDKKLIDHMTNETHELASEVAKLLLNAFPEGDPVAHKKRHELELKRMEDRAAFWEKMRFELTRWGLIGFLGWAAWALWRAALLGPKP